MPFFHALGNPGGACGRCCRWTSLRSRSVQDRIWPLVDGIKGPGKLTLPVAAAKVDVEKASASNRLDVRGYLGDDVGPLLPVWTDVGVAQYSGCMKAISDIQAKITSTPASDGDAVTGRVPGGRPV